MIRRTVIAATGLLVFLSLSVTTQSVHAQDTKTTESKSSEGRPLKKLRKKVRNMRPSVKARKAVIKKVKGDKPETTPAQTPVSK